MFITWYINLFNLFLNLNILLKNVLKSIPHRKTIDKEQKQVNVVTTACSINQWYTGSVHVQPVCDRTSLESHWDFIFIITSEVDTFIDTSFFKTLILYQVFYIVPY